MGARHYDHNLNKTCFVANYVAMGTRDYENALDDNLFRSKLRRNGHAQLWS